MPWYVIVIIVFVASVILSVFISLPLYLAIKTTHPLHLSREEVTSLWKEKRFASEYDKTLRKDITFTMDDGYIIHGDYMLYPGSKKFVICCHGYSVNREAELEYGLIFYRLGYNVVLFDERGHGDNEQFISTMGYLESKDLNNLNSNPNSSNNGKENNLNNIENKVNKEIEEEIKKEENKKENEKGDLGNVQENEVNFSF